MNNSLIITPRYNTKSKFQTIIKKKRLQLALINSKFEMLKMELDNIKHEYYFRIGSLMQRDNTLDMDIIVHKKILTYLKNGFTYKEAVNKINGEFNKEKQEILEEEEEIYTKRAEVIDDEKIVDDNLKELKKLWKKAVMKFHPDLASDQTEKKERENIMKKINQAYSERNFEELNEVYKNTNIFPTKDMSIEDLQVILVNLENKVIQVKNNLLELKKTEWFNWKTKMKIAKKSGVDIFKEMEDSLLDDVLKKLRILSELKSEIDSF